MGQRIKHMLVMSAMLLCSSGVWADDELVIIKQLDGIGNDAAGKVEYVISDGMCNLTITPAKGNYITGRYIWGEKIISGEYSQSRSHTPAIADAITVKPVAEHFDSTTVVAFTFDMPSEEYRVRLLVDFRSLKTYPLWVGDIQVDAHNCGNVLADDRASVSFNTKRNVLVLDNASLEGHPVRSSLDSLTVYLLRESRISAEQTAPFVNTDATRLIPLKFSTDANVPGMLSVGFSGGQMTDGFAVSYEYNLVAVKENDNEYDIKVPVKPAEFDIENYDGEVAEYHFPAENFQEEGEDVDLNNTEIGGVLFTLGDSTLPTGSGFDDGTTNNDGPGIVLNTVVTSDDMDNLSDCQPGTSEYANTFAGMTVAVPAGLGHFFVDAATEGEYALGIQVGDGEPLTMSGLSKGDPVKVAYSTSEPCYVRIYNAGIVSGASEARPWHGGKKTATHIKVYGVSVEPEVLIGVNSISSVFGVESEPVKVVGASDACYVSGSDGTSGGYSLNEVLGKTVTDLSENVFDGVDMSNVNYVDLSKSDVKGLVVSRSAGQFAGVAPQTLIFLPDGNDAGSEPNVIVGGVCSHLNLSSGTDGSFYTPYDFQARNFDFDRVYVSGQPEAYYMPLELTAAQTAALGTFHTLREVTGQRAVFNHAVEGGIYANRPYAFIPKVSKISLENVDVKAKVMMMMSMPDGLFGTYEMIDVHDGDNLYRLESGSDGARFVHLAEGETIRPFSAYLVAAGAPAQLEMVVDDVTGITQVDAVPVLQEQWFTVDGQRCDGMPSRKGIYILRSGDGCRQGKKIVVR